MTKGCQVFNVSSCVDNLFQIEILNTKEIVHNILNIQHKHFKYLTLTEWENILYNKIGFYVGK